MWLASIYIIIFSYYLSIISLFVRRQNQRQNNRTSVPHDAIFDLVHVLVEGVFVYGALLYLSVCPFAAFLSLHRVTKIWW